MPSALVGHIRKVIRNYPLDEWEATCNQRALLKAQEAERDALKKQNIITPNVFFRLVADGRGGDKRPPQITTFDKAWKKACRLAGCPGRIPHDLRRTAIRNMVRARLRREVALLDGEVEHPLQQRKLPVDLRVAHVADSLTRVLKRVARNTLDAWTPAPKLSGHGEASGSRT
jgi:integrase